MSQESAQCITTSPPQALEQTEPGAMISSKSRMGEACTIVTNDVQDQPFSDAPSSAGGEMRSKTDKSIEPGESLEEELNVPSASFILGRAENRKHGAELLPEARVEDSDTQDIEEQPVSPSRDPSSTSSATS